MLNSLHSRLLLLVIIVLLVAGSLAVWLAGGAITGSVEQYISENENETLQRRQRLERVLPHLLAAYYSQNLSWEAVDGILIDFGDLVEEGIMLSDADGRTIIDSAYLQTGQPLTAQTDGYLIPIPLGTKLLGTVRIASIPKNVDSETGRKLLTDVNRSLFLAMLTAGTMAVLLTLAFSRKILNPIAQLTLAVRKMEKGELDQRVDPGSISEFRELASAFNAMADSLTQAESLRRNMVTDVAHELRTPLSNVRGYLEAVQDGVVQPTTELIASLHEEVMLLSHLVDDLQELALAEAGQLKLNRDAVPVDHIIESALQLVQHPLRDHDITLNIKIAPSLPPIYADNERIGQVLRNLLSNAITHTPKHGTVSVTAHQRENSVAIEIENSGQGIAPEHLPYVFERFYRIDGSRTRSTGGSGLGLAIVKHIVTAHGGTIEAESIPGKTTRFRFTMPINPPIDSTSKLVPFLDTSQVLPQRA